MYEDSNVTIYDPTSIDWTSFKWKNGYYTHIVSELDIIKPYMILYKYDMSIEYEDAILLLNNIEFIWDLAPGSKLKIPKIDDLKSFISDNTK